MHVNAVKKVLYAECQAAAAKFTEEGGAMDERRYLDIEEEVKERLPIRLLTDAVKTVTATTIDANGQKQQTRVEVPVYKSVEWCDAHW